MRISIIGSGVVGKTTGIGLHMRGNEVIFHDVNRKKLNELKKQGYEVADSILEAVTGSAISLVCVQTPTVQGRANLSYVKKATKDVAESLRRKENYHVIAIRSTVLPSTTRNMIIPLLEQHSKLRAGEDFGICVNPEFLRQTSALSDFLKPSRIVIGEFDKQSGDLLETLYTPFGAPIYRTNLETAEMVKYVANTFLSTKISFFNEMYMICKSFGLSPHSISEIVALDPRISNHGIYGGRPFEGSCLPKDLEAFINFVKENQHNPKLLDAVLYINQKVTKTLSANGET